MALSLVAWTIVAVVHVVPWLARRTRRDALLVVVTPHLFRHVGALAVFPGIGAPPAVWAVPLAWGDGITAVLAALTMVALHRSWAFAIAFAWVFNVFGTLDLLHNVANAVALVVAPTLGPIAFVAAFVVPAMLVSHVLVFRTLLRPLGRERPQGRDQRP